MLRSLPINKVYDNVVDKIVSIHVSIRGVGMDGYGASGLCH